MNHNGEKMKKIIVAIIAIVVLALGAVFVSAQKADHKGSHEGRGFRKGGHHRGGGMMLRGLDLTDAQKAQVKEIMEASKAKVQPLRESMKANRQKLQAATENGKFDEAAVQALANENASLSAQLLVERSRVKSQIFNILTPEQREKAAQLKSQMKERFKGKGRGDGKHFRGGEKKTDTPKE
jgi:Spy/CpxP family protein refolding chaperone